MASVTLEGFLRQNAPAKGRLPLHVGTLNVHTTSASQVPYLFSFEMYPQILRVGIPPSDFTSYEATSHRSSHA
jgi:hypothetical protein